MNLNLGRKVAQNTNILTYEVPPELDRTVKTEIDYVDQIFGGEGLTPSMSCVFSGEPGAGKTTMMLQVADSLTRLGHICLFNTNEEAVVQLRKTVRRLNIKHGFIVGNDRLVPDVIKHARKLQEKCRGQKAKDGSPVQVVVMIDSVNAHDDGKYANGHTNSRTGVRVVEMLTDWAKNKVAGQYGIAIMLSQCTKSGEFSGRNAVIHTADAHLHLRIDQDTKSISYGQRLLEMRKNRMGAGHQAVALEVTRGGIKPALV